MQIRVEVLADHFHVVEQLGDALQCVKLALDRNDDLRCGGHGVQRQQTQGRRAVDADVVVFALHLRQRLFEKHRPVFHIHQLNLRRRKVDARRENIEVFVLRADYGVFRVLPLYYNIINRAFDFPLVDAEPGGGVALGVRIHKEDPSPRSVCQRSRKVHRRGGLSDSAFLVCECYYFAHYFLRYHLILSNYKRLSLFFQ